MRLLNVSTREFEEFTGKDTPWYAILSHTWGEEEVTFSDMAQKTYANKLGYRKIDGCCRQARDDGLDYVWVDTCCIDKSSSAELSEAINSMFMWYEESAICYVYLADVPHQSDVLSNDSEFKKSRWFRRGWTLQELLAPKCIAFFDQTWLPIITRRGHLTLGRRSQNTNELPSPLPLIPRDDDILVTLISEATGISREYIHKSPEPRNLHFASIAERMSWMARRDTSRREDSAYCLLGIFDVNMPTIYGEGAKAFRRLQEEIIKQSPDQSIFSWSYGIRLCDAPYLPSDGGLFATTPGKFIYGGLVKSDEDFFSGEAILPHYAMTNRGLQLDMLLWQPIRNMPLVYGRLNCSSYPRNAREVLLLPLIISRNENPKDLSRLVLRRSKFQPPQSIQLKLIRKYLRRKAVYIEGTENNFSYIALRLRDKTVTLKVSSVIGGRGDLSLTEAFPFEDCRLSDTTGESVAIDVETRYYDSPSTYFLLYAGTDTGIIVAVELAAGQRARLTAKRCEQTPSLLGLMATHGLQKLRKTFDWKIGGGPVALPAGYLTFRMLDERERDGTVLLSGQYVSDAVSLVSEHIQARLDTP